MRLIEPISQYQCIGLCIYLAYLGSITQASPLDESIEFQGCHLYIVFLGHKIVIILIDILSDGSFASVCEHDGGIYIIHMEAAVSCIACHHSVGQCLCDRTT